MDVSGVGSSLAAQQAATIAGAEALVLRAGQEITATVLEIMDHHVMLDVAGQRLSATLQTDRQLAPGQVVQLVAVDVQPEQITLRLVADEMLTGLPGQQALVSAGLPDTPENRVALVALVAEGEPVTAEAIQTLRQVAISLGAMTPEDVHAAAYLLARDLPLTEGLLDVVRDGQAVGRDLPALEDQLRLQAAQLLDQAQDELQSAAPELRALLAEIAGFVHEGQAPFTAAALQSLIRQLGDSLEALLARVVANGGAGREPLSDAAVGPGPGDDAPGAQPGAVPPSSLSGGPPLSTAPGPQGSPSVQAEPVGQSRSGASQPPTAQAPAAQAAPAEAQAAPPAELGAAEVQLGPPLPRPGQGQAGAVATGGGAQTGQEPAPAGPQLRPSQPPAASGPGQPHERGLPSLSSPAGASPIHETARRLIPALDRAMQSASTLTAAAPLTELRETAARLVHAIQFRQLEILLQPTPAEPYAAFPLPVPQPLGEGELRLYVRDGNGGGSPKIDPNDVRLVVDLRLSQLKRVSVVVHVYQRQLFCHIEAESLHAQRLLEASAPELRDSLRGLGYAVEPIHCSMATLSRRTSGGEVTLSLSKLGRLNVTA
jgi:hypothetical protein